MRRPVGAAIFTLVLASAAFADADLPKLVHKWGLVGKWSTDCSPAATPHAVVAYEIEPDGRTTIDSGLRLIEMRIANIKPDGDLVLHTTSSGQISVLMLRRSGDTLRPVIDDYSVREGKFVASLRETSPLRQCKN